MLTRLLRLGMAVKDVKTLALCSLSRRFVWTLPKNGLFIPERRIAAPADVDLGRNEA